MTAIMTAVKVTMVQVEPGLETLYRRFDEFWTSTKQPPHEADGVGLQPHILWDQGAPDALG